MSDGSCGAHLRVLVAQSDLGMAAALESELEAAGLCADFCHDGQEGLLMALTGDYDVIVLDPVLQEANGYPVSAELRRLEVPTPILEFGEALGAREPAEPRPAGDLTLDASRLACRRGEVEIPLTPREGALLEYLLRRAGQVVSKQEILDQVWDFAFDATPRMVERSISSLQRKIDRPSTRHQYLQVIEDAGYRLLAPDE